MICTLCKDITLLYLIRKKVNSDNKVGIINIINTKFIHCLITIGHLEVLVVCILLFYM